MDSLFESASSKLGGNPSPEQLKIVASILSSYPCAILFNMIPSSRIQLKHIFSIAVTTFIMNSVLHCTRGFAHISLSCLFTWIFMKYYKRKSGPWVNFIVIMASMSVCHLVRQFRGFDLDNANDYSGTMMIAIIKLTSFGFNVADGRVKNQAFLSSYNKRMKIDRYPTFLEFFGWMFFFGGFLVGPTSEYMDYVRFVTMDMFEIKDNNKKLPSAVRQTGWLIFKSLMFVCVIVTVAPSYNSANVDTIVWRELPFIKKLFYLQVAAFTSRCKYYVAWFLSEGACVLCRFGYNGVDAKGRPRWDRFKNIDVRKCELSQSIKEMIDNWNIGANRWLRYYVYMRITPFGQTGGAKSALITYGVSALWHGFYPGYYMFFLSVTPFQMLARHYRRTFRPLTFDPISRKSITALKLLYDLTGTILTMFIINLLSVAFNLLYWKPASTAWAQIYYVHYIVGIIGYIFWKSVNASIKK
ncbi:unnamed protein product [Mucor hiemalis]